MNLVIPMAGRRKRCVLLRRFNQLTADLASTQGVLLAVGAVMLMVTLTTLSSDELGGLPLQSLLVPLGVMMAVLGIAGWFLDSKSIRRWTGGCLFVYSQVRSVAWGYTMARRTTGVAEWLSESTPVWVWQLPALLGFLVWARARREPFREGR